MAFGGNSRHGDCRFLHEGEGAASKAGGPRAQKRRV
jgi:hypothetical protein